MALSINILLYSNICMRSRTAIKVNVLVTIDDEFISAGAASSNDFVTYSNAVLRSKIRIEGNGRAVSRFKTAGGIFKAFVSDAAIRSIAIAA